VILKAQHGELADWFLGVRQNVPYETYSCSFVLAAVSLSQWRKCRTPVKIMAIP
jgi:hypothetical protein